MITTIFTLESNAQWHSAADYNDLIKEHQVVEDLMSEKRFVVELIGDSDTIKSRVDELNKKNEDWYGTGSKFNYMSRPYYKVEFYGKEGMKSEYMFLDMNITSKERVSGYDGEIYVKEIMAVSVDYIGYLYKNLSTCN